MSFKKNLRNLKERKREREVREGKIPDLPVGNTVAGAGDSKWKRNINHLLPVYLRSPII